MVRSEPTRTGGGDGTRLTNGVIETVVLADGGHFAELRFCDGAGPSTQNVLWETPWATHGVAVDAEEKRTKTGGFTGHGLCLDYFGAASAEDAARGLGIHGEAAARRWEVAGDPEEEGSFRWTVELPQTQLHLERRIALAEGESVLFVEGRVRNERDAEHRLDWVEHATFSPPFLQAGESTVAASAKRGYSMPYENASLLRPHEEFLWPFAPGQDGPVDLRRPFTVRGRGCLAAMEMDPERDHEFVLAMNWKLRLGVGYCFRRCDFPWMAIWEENCARQDSPWKGVHQARGMEFGTTPLPEGRGQRELFGRNTGCAVAGGGERVARFLMFVFPVPDEVRAIEDAEVRENELVLRGEGGPEEFAVAAKGCRAFLE